MPRLRLHLKVLMEPAITVDMAVTSARSVFAQAWIDVQVVSKAALQLPDLESVRITDSCQPPGPLTEDQLNLFDHARGIGSKDIVIFFVQSTIRATSGCSQHPASVAGAVISEACSRWTMAHEIGHLLKLTHATGTNRLMFKSTNRIKADPPNLDQSEIEIILKSDLVSHP
jgi:hypothetical protein